jgi:ketosteroid isomerase-like protein
VAAAALALVVATVSMGAAWTGPGDDDRSVADELMAADRAFAAAAAERGLDGWMEFLAPDAARVDLRGDVVRGTEAIRASDEALFADPQVRLTWEPAVAGAYQGGDLGFTKGRYALVLLPEDEGADTQTLSAGDYLTVWRRDAGTWKVILDTGVPDPVDEG